MTKVIKYESDAELLSKLQRMVKENMRRIEGPTAAYEFFKAYGAKEQEHFFIAILDGTHQIIDVVTITVGLVNRTIVHPREVFRPALMVNAAAIIVGHNHPSGLLEPSSEDKEITSRLKDAGMLLGIPVLDHLIVGRTGFISMVEIGVMS